MIFHSLLTNSLPSSVVVLKEYLVLLTDKHPWGDWFLLDTLYPTERLLFFIVFQLLNLQFIPIIFVLRLYHQLLIYKILKVLSHFFFSQLFRHLQFIAGIFPFQEHYEACLYLSFFQLQFRFFEVLFQLRYVKLIQDFFLYLKWIFIFRLQPRPPLLSSIGSSTLPAHFLFNLFWFSLFTPYFQSTK